MSKKSNRVKARLQLLDSLELIRKMAGDPTIQRELARQGKRIDMAEVVRMMNDAAGWKSEYDIVVDAK